ncbi:MAG: hypothetical protein LBG18_05870 [Mediterranea sp.]|jgi:hypothetical protein|nr:hypothetical protein [Mediterranea sp.]
MEDYKKAVEYYALKRINDLLHNEGNEHALIIFENIFKNAKKHIRIAARDLSNKQVANTCGYINAMKIFLEKKDAKLDILLVKFNKDVTEIQENNFFRFLFETDAYKNNNVRIKDSNGKCFSLKNEEVHFCTADSHMYRIEDDVIKRSARCNFGDESGTKNLEDKFDNAFGSIDKTVDLKEYFLKRA